MNLSTHATVAYSMEAVEPDRPRTNASLVNPCFIEYSLIFNSHSSC
jgi:hypothetical protein